MILTLALVSLRYSLTIYSLTIGLILNIAFMHTHGHICIQIWYYPAGAIVTSV
jgi:hypothetical protein